MGDLVSQLPLTAVHHVMVEVPGFQIMGTGTLVALVSVETRLHSLSSAEPVGEAAEGHGMVHVSGSVDWVLRVMSLPGSSSS